jgi:hypothetical protein
MDEKPKKKRRNMTEDEKEILKIYREAKKLHLELLERMHLAKEGELRTAVIRNATENCPFKEYCKVKI